MSAARPVAFAAEDGVRQVGADLNLIEMDMGGVPGEE